MQSWCTWSWTETTSFFFSSRRRHTRFDCDWSSDVCSSDLEGLGLELGDALPAEKIHASLVMSASSCRNDGEMAARVRSEEHTSELQSQSNLVCRLLLEKKKKSKNKVMIYTERDANLHKM